MSLTVQSGVPTTLTVGDAISFKVTDSNFPATTWTSKILFKTGNDSPKSFEGTASGSDHLFQLTNAQTGTLIVGKNLVCLVFNDGTNRQSTDWTEVTVLPNPENAEAKSFAQQQVELLRKVIAKLNGTDKAVVDLNGHNFERVKIKDYQDQLTYWEGRASRELSATGRVARNHTIVPKFIHGCEPDPFPLSTTTP
jgi:hypothetical protein